MDALNASLIYRDKDELKHIILLPGNRVKFGRDHSNDIRLALFPIQEVVFQLATTDISRQHFMIYRKTEDHYTIQDLNSTNGTSLNCVALISKEKLLNEGQTIDIGGVLDMQVRLKKDVLWLQRLTNTPQESYMLFPKNITIGTAESNAVVLQDQQICPHHLNLNYENRQYTLALVDNEATITINNIPVTDGENIVLENETNIAIGDTEILFRLHQKKTPVE